jgi:hypothetical protein
MRRTLACLGLLFVALLVTPAGAVVNQVDGQVVPLQQGSPCPGDWDECIQTGLNWGEGINPPTGNGPIDAIIDANTGPEVFLVPQTAGVFNVVNFKLLQEGAGYENIFGWYNVGDPTKRYPAIFSCRGGNQSTYEPPNYTVSPVTGGYTFTIDFEAEYQAGRYQGKLIGFYLVTPEGNQTGSSCAADPSDLGTLTSGGPIDDDNSGSATDDAQGFGRIYFTENKLNNDGNYVHYLIYQSVMNAEHYYFGFEDLFRGGDNDYDDTLVKVEGLVPVCQPSAEICNGVDDNCNGAIDENLFQSCSTACGTGQEQCQFSNDGDPTNDWVNCSAPAGSPEVCNGVDDDCDGTIDNNLGTLPPCTLGGCTGVMICQGGKLVCGASAPSTEICDGLDNDCDGSIDENLTRPCVTSCGPGIETCDFSDDGDPTNDWINCTAPTPGTEVCNGVDDDCNGKVDDNVPGEGDPCPEPPEADTCTQGQTKCVGGKIVCVGEVKILPEICDCKDNDCDGEIDEGDLCDAPAECVDCGCRLPCSGDEFGCPKDFSCKNGYCVPDKCASVTCEPGEKCENGICVNLCAGINCPTGQVCSNGICVADDCYGKGCPAGQVCSGGECVVDPCADVTCQDDEFCSNGKCLPSCGAVTCGKGEICEDGKCRPDPCANVTCQHGIACVDGKCDDACSGVACGPGQICRDGDCVDDPCLLVECFGADEVCQDGQCISSKTYAGGEVERVLAAGGGGCAMANGPPSCGLVFILLGLLLTLVGRRHNGGVR